MGRRGSIRTVSRHGGINRAFLWIKKVLEVTEVTNVPEAVLDRVHVSSDLFGWERIPEAQAQTAAGTNVSFVTSQAVPDDTVRIVLAASVETSNDADAISLWLELDTAVARGAPGSLVGITTPFLTLVGSVNPQRPGTHRPYLMSPGDTTIARASALVGAAETLTIRLRFIDLPIGEYIPHV